MSFTTKKIILFLSALVLVLAIFLFRDFFLDTMLGISLLVLFLVAHLIVTLIWWRCPHCNAYLHKLSMFATHCPFCGEKLE